MCSHEYTRLATEAVFILQKKNYPFSFYVIFIPLNSSFAFVLSWVPFFVKNYP
jgi:hypothetical protein